MTLEGGGFDIESESGIALDNQEFHERMFRSVFTRYWLAVEAEIY
jgi:hypothetical protein